MSLECTFDYENEKYFYLVDIKNNILGHDLTVEYSINYGSYELLGVAPSHSNNGEALFSIPVGQYSIIQLRAKHLNTETNKWIYSQVKTIDLSCSCPTPTFTSTEARPLSLGQRYVYGFYHNENLIPIEGAIVSVIQGGNVVASAITNSNLTYNYNIIIPQPIFEESFSIRFVKNGYQTEEIRGCDFSCTSKILSTQAKQSQSTPTATLYSERISVSVERLDRYAYLQEAPIVPEFRIKDEHYTTYGTNCSNLNIYASAITNRTENTRAFIDINSTYEIYHSSFEYLIYYTC